MKRLVTSVATLLAVLCTAQYASALPGRAEVKKITGKATFTNAQGASASLADNMVLGSGDTIITGPNSTVDINLGVNGDVLRVEPDSTLKIDQLDVTRVSPPIVNTKLDVTKGGVTANVINKLASASRYEVKTPSGVAGIRGTIFNANVGTGISCLHGQVNVTSAGGVSVSLFAGQTAAPGAAQPAAIAQAILAQSMRSVSGATATVSPAQLANTVNTIAQATAATAAQAVIQAGGTPAQAATAAATAAQQTITQVTAALNAVAATLPAATQNIVQSVVASSGTTATAAAAVGAASGIVAGGGTVQAAQQAAQSAAQQTATATGTTLTATQSASITTVANSAATNTAAAVQSGASGSAALNSTVSQAVASTTTTVTTSTGTGGGTTTAAQITQNPLDTSKSATQ